MVVISPLKLEVQSYVEPLGEAATRTAIKIPQPINPRTPRTVPLLVSKPHTPLPLVLRLVPSDQAKDNGHNRACHWYHGHKAEDERHYGHAVPAICTSVARTP